LLSAALALQIDSSTANVQIQIRKAFIFTSHIFTSQFYVQSRAAEELRVSLTPGRR
jgi:hypothetical protein